MARAAVTGHTSGLGKLIAEYFESMNYQVQGFSQSTGYDLRDYSHVTRMLDQVNDFELFVNCAKPDFAQAQILYRLIRTEFKGKILNIGTPAVHQDLGWIDLGLLEYLTQKTALLHAHQTLSRLYPDKMIMWEPHHVESAEYVKQSLDGLKF